MDKKEIIALIIETADRWELPPALVRAVVQAESNYNPFAARYEPSFLKRYLLHINPKLFGPVTRKTERQHRATSWGLMQIMGTVARELGFDQTFLTKLVDPVTNLEYGCKKLTQEHRQHFDKFGWDGVISGYNAGTPKKLESGKFRNQAYVDKVNKYWNHYNANPRM